MINTSNLHGVIATRCRKINSALLSLAFAAGLLWPSHAAGDSQKQRIFEAYPERIQAQLENRDRALRSLPQQIDGNSVEYVITITKRWVPGQALRVAFLGGDSQLRTDIAEAAKEWTEKTNIRLDFGSDAAAGRFREWSPSDSSFVSEIRISFDQEGYWSLVGTDSIDSSLSPPNQASMNFGRFDSSRPNDWRTIVLHEFGHALGFQHEHQSPIGGCDEDFRWEDDPGYVQTRDQFGQYIADPNNKRPGLYTMLAGPPNNWPKEKVDFNLRQLQEPVSAFQVSGFDVNSIMKYYFPDWMFRSGVSSHCYSLENIDLSDGDRKGVAIAYPVAHAQSQHIMEQQKGFLNTLERMTPEKREKYQQQLKQFPQ